MNLWSNLEKVALFGKKFGLNLARLAQYGQICSFKDRYLKFTLRRHFHSYEIFKSNLEKVVLFGINLAQYSDYFDI